MGIFYQTVLVTDYSNPANSRTIVLDSMNEIIESHERARGWVDKQQLLAAAGGRIHEQDIGPNSRIVEYMVTTYDGPQGFENAVFEIRSH